MSREVARTRDRGDLPGRWAQKARWVRSAVGAAVLVVLFVRLGPAPFVTAVDRLSWSAIAAALLITFAATLCAAWRWSVVTRALDVGITLPAATVAYYRSQFLNSTLPGGVLGDVHRAVRHGHDVDRTGPGMRSVLWERVLGQVVQIVLTVVVVAVLPSALRPVAAAAFVGFVVVGVGLALVRGRVVRALTRRQVSRAVLAEGRVVLASPRTRGVLVLSSVLAVTGHVAVLLVAMAAVGVDASPGRQVALALVTLLGAAVPASLAGWGPREGVAAWVFGVGGLGAATGLTVAVLYGVLALIATLPGAVLLLVPGRSAGRTRRGADPRVGAGDQLAPR